MGFNLSFSYCSNIHPFTDETFKILKQTSYNRLNVKAWLTAVVLLSVNNTPLVSVDLIGEKNQVILEYEIKTIYNIKNQVIV